MFGFDNPEWLTQEYAQRLAPSFRKYYSNISLILIGLWLSADSSIHLFYANKSQIERKQYFLKGFENTLIKGINKNNNLKKVEESVLQFWRIYMPTILP